MIDRYTENTIDQMQRRFSRGKLLRNFNGISALSRVDTEDPCYRHSLIYLNPFNCNLLSLFRW
jgi:hypothetical protein